MKIYANLFPDGKKFALTMSYDDGRIYDKRLVEIFNKHGIKGTFHLNSTRMFSPEHHVILDEVKDVYKGHEVSCHLATHPYPCMVPDTSLINEVMEDRRALEKACGYTVRGMSYPFGNFNERSIGVLSVCGMKYSRTTISTNNFMPPENFMKWNPTCHHKADLKGIFDRFLKGNTNPIALYHNTMYVWGHSYEFENDNNWNVIEEFCEYASGNNDIWYATNIELYDYITASRNLCVGVDGKTVYNPSNITVWVHADGTPVEIKPGENIL